MTSLKDDDDLNTFRNHYFHSDEFNDLRLFVTLMYILACHVINVNILDTTSTTVRPVTNMTNSLI